MHKITDTTQRFVAFGKYNNKIAWITRNAHYRDFISRQPRDATKNCSLKNFHFFFVRHHKAEQNPRQECIMMALEHYKTWSHTMATKKVHNHKYQLVTWRLYKLYQLNHSWKKWKSIYVHFPLSRKWTE
jgi:hypothetical protein